MDNKKLAAAIAAAVGRPDAAVEVEAILAERHEPITGTQAGEDLTTEQVAVALKMKPCTILNYRVTAPDRLPPGSYKVGRRVLWPRAEFEKWKAARATTTTRVHKNKGGRPTNASKIRAATAGGV